MEVPLTRIQNVYGMEKCIVEHNNTLSSIRIGSRSKGVRGLNPYTISKGV